MIRSVPLKLILSLLLICTLASGVFAVWVYMAPPEETFEDITSTIGKFPYGTLYITDVEVVGGSYSSASASKKGDLNMSANLSLNKNTSSTVVVNVTFYNSTDVSYYYNETETVSSNNSGITYAVSGIAQKEEVPSKTYKTLTVTFKFSGSNTSNAALIGELHFKFAVDKDSIGIIVAQTAVTRFADILNNVVAPDSYQTLENTMNNRGRNSSAVSYIGNVSGASDSDSTFIQEMFTNEFLNMDLDGDGKSEPITLMIKRENLDGNSQTGDEYTYKNLLGINQTVYGAEMTIYITSEGFSSNTLTVYAATFTKLNGSDTWIEVVPLTKGTATANRYSFGFGGNNSFNTDTWKSDNNQTMDTLTQRATASLS